jgi:hypothetical protein
MVAVIARQLMADIEHHGPDGFLVELVLVARHGAGVATFLDQPGVFPNAVGGAMEGQVGRAGVEVGNGRGKAVPFASHPMTRRRDMPRTFSGGKDSAAPSGAPVPAAPFWGVLFLLVSSDLRPGGPKVTPVRYENVSPGEHGLVRRRKSSHAELSGDNQAISLGSLGAGTHRSGRCSCIVQPRSRNPLPSRRGGRQTPSSSADRSAARRPGFRHRVPAGCRARPTPAGPASRGLRLPVALSAWSTRHQRGVG